MTIKDLSELLQDDLLAYLDTLSDEQRTIVCQIVLERIKQYEAEVVKKGCPT